MNPQAQYTELRIHLRVTYMDSGYAVAELERIHRELQANQPTQGALAYVAGYGQLLALRQRLRPTIFPLGSDTLRAMVLPRGTPVQ